MSLGSYPFFGADGYGSNLVLRGRDPDELTATVGELMEALRGYRHRQCARGRRRVNRSSVCRSAARKLLVSIVELEWEMAW